ncbi:hypothetical protein [Nocardia sp. NBC_01388]|uniref:hypothetical protein n=1 Tax=Nocardia sp. NBC_01388 TaxID=2903596 RepID=UPI003245C2CF
MDRRGFVRIVGATMTGLRARPVIDLAQLGRARRVREDVVDEMDAITAGLRRLDDGGQGDILLWSIRAHLHDVVGLIESGSYPDPLGRRLHSTAAELLRLAGWVSFDNGHHAHAQRYWTSAVYTARTAGDHALSANAIGFLSCQAKDIGRPQDAVTLAESALSEYRGTSAGVSAILHLRAAEAHAGAGAIAMCRTEIDAAFTSLERPHTGTPTWAYWLDRAQAHGQAGYCYLRLAQYTDARRHLREALRTQDPAAIREGALRNTLLAKTYVRQTDPEVDRALSHAGAAVAALSGQASSARCVGHLTGLLRDLVPYRRRPAVQEFADHLHYLR